MSLSLRRCRGKYLKWQEANMQNSGHLIPQENGKIERNWETITSMARCLLEHSVIEKPCWPSALSMPRQIVISGSTSAEDTILGNVQKET